MSRHSSFDLMVEEGSKSLSLSPDSNLQGDLRYFATSARS